MRIDSIGKRIIPVLEATHLIQKQIKVLWNKQWLGSSRFSDCVTCLCWLPPWCGIIGLVGETVTWSRDKKKSAFHYMLLIFSRIVAYSSSFKNFLKCKNDICMPLQTLQSKLIFISLHTIYLKSSIDCNQND